jgi:hypothetical protein
VIDYKNLALKILFIISAINMYQISLDEDSDILYDSTNVSRFFIDYAKGEDVLFQMMSFFAMMGIMLIILFLSLDNYKKSYRGLVLLRYGKNNYIKVSRKEAIFGCVKVCAVLTAVLLCMTLINNDFKNIDILSDVFQILKDFLWLYIIALVDFYLELKDIEQWIIPVSICILFLQIILDRNIFTIPLLLWGNAVVNLKAVVINLLIIILIKCIIKLEVRRTDFL